MTEELRSSQGDCISLFVYGTLKQGYSNHSAYCSAALSIHPARCWGRLYHLAAGYPALVIPNEHILLQGTADIAGDLQRQQQLQTGFPQSPSELTNPGDWQWISGELIHLPRPQKLLPPIDELEDFYPEKSNIGYISEYQRVLITVQAGQQHHLAWVYWMPVIVGARRVVGGVWPGD